MTGARDAFTSCLVDIVSLWAGEWLVLKPDAKRLKVRIESRIRRSAVCHRLGLFGSTVEGTAKSDCNRLNLDTVSARTCAGFLRSS